MAQKRKAPDLPDWEMNRGRSKPRPQERSQRRQSPPADRPLQKKPQRKPMPPLTRKLTAVLVLLVMAGVTCLLVVFLLFKVTDITVTGDTIPGATSPEIIRLCGYETGDNLAFLPTSQQKVDLRERYPYIGGVEILRHYPGTVEILLTAARPAAAVQQNAQWVLLSEEGKILEVGSELPAGVPVITGFTLTAPVPGESFELENEETFAALEEIMQTLGEQQVTGDVTLIDFTDLSDIRLTYQNRIEFRLGNTLSVSYKVQLGCKAVEELGDHEEGVLDLTLAAETRRAGFTSGQISSTLQTQPAAGNPAEPAPGGAAEPAGDTPGDGGEPVDEPPATTGRDGDIPAGVYAIG